jgi:hypothetical protein
VIPFTGRRTLRSSLKFVGAQIQRESLGYNRLKFELSAGKICYIRTPISGRRKRVQEGAVLGREVPVRTGMGRRFLYTGDARAVIGQGRE